MAGAFAGVGLAGGDGGLAEDGGDVLVAAFVPSLAFAGAGLLVQRGAPAPGGQVAGGGEAGQSAPVSAITSWAARLIRLHTRYRRDLTDERTREKQRAEKLLESALLTEQRGKIPEFSGRAGECVATFPAHDHRGRCAAGRVVVGGAAARVA